MHVTASSAMKCLLDLLNLNFSSPTKAEKKKVDAFLAEAYPRYDINVARRLQAKWQRTLFPLVQVWSLEDSLKIGISVHEGLIRTQKDSIVEREKRAKAREEEVRKEGRDPKQDKELKWQLEEIKEFKRELKELERSKARMESDTEMGRKDIERKADQIRKDLRGARFLTREEALKKLIAELNAWSGDRAIRLQWRLRPAKKAVGYMEPGQGLLRIGRNKFVVDRWHITRGLEDISYSVIAKCLETGELSRLRRCNFCEQFFFAQHLRKFYCRPEHQKKHDKLLAPKRVKEWRARQRETES